MTMSGKALLLFCIYLAVSFFSAFGAVQAGTLNVAVASNFINTMKVLSKAFENSSGYRLRISSASTGKLYMQIQHGAPFDVLLAADEKHPDMLLAENMADEASAYVYSIGKLVFISNIQTDGECLDVLRSPDLKRISIANPKTAPYGFAARQVMEKLGVWSQLESRLVMAGNVAQALQFVSTGNAQAGFIASSMVTIDEEHDNACIWAVPADMHSPLKQKMVLLNKAKNKTSASAFFRFMHSDEARKIIIAEGYDVL